MNYLCSTRLLYARCCDGLDDVYFNPDLLAPMQDSCIVPSVGILTLCPDV